MITFADLITLLICCFVYLSLFSKPAVNLDTQFKVTENNTIKPKKNNTNKTQQDNHEAPKENPSSNIEDDSKIKEKQKKINELLKNNINTDNSEKNIKDILNHLPKKSINNKGFYNGESNGYN